MLEKKRIVTCVILAFFVLFAGGAANADDQTWLRNILKWKATEQVQLWSAQEFRNRGFSLYKDPFVEFLEFGIQVAPLKGIYGAVGYRRQWNEVGNMTVNENRWIAMAGAKATGFADLAIAVRLRFDGKYFDHPEVEDYIWYRLLVSPSYRASLAGAEITPHFTYEIFGDTRPQSKIFFNRKRFHFGASFGIGSHLRPLVEYMRQDTHNRETDHAIRAQLVWSI